MNPNLLQSSSSLFIIFLTLFNINLSSSSHRIDSRYENCASNSSNNCGTSLQIAYPFWGNGRPQYCGHPGFELSCEGSNLTLNITSETYNVIDINYNTSVLTIAREEFSQGECPRQKDLHNTTLDLTLFNYTSNVKNATLFYNCLESKVSKNAPFSFSCEGSYPNGLSFFVITQEWEHQLDKVCGVKVYVPVFSNAIHDLVDNLLTVGDVLKGGFEVKWVIDEGNCQECFISGGCCGYNMTLAQSTCFCEQGAFSKTCPASTPSKGLNTGARIGIGIGVGGGGILIIMLFFFVRSQKEDASRSSPETPLPSTTNLQDKGTYFGAHLFSSKELEQATNNFDPSKELGKGGFGVVYHGKLQDGSDVAIKRLHEKQNKQVLQFMNELEILTRLNHKHLVKLYGCTTRHSRELLLVYEYVPNGTVADHLHRKRAKPRILPWTLRLRIAIETAKALVYLHSSDIIHRDVKTKNILLDANYSVKVADFGLSRLFPLDVTHVSTTPQGSPGYVDPEYHQCYQLTDKSDVYSFGVVLAELISSKPAVDRRRNKDEISLSNMAIKKIQNHGLSEFVDQSLGFESNSRVREEVIAVAELTFQCLQATRETRPSMKEVLTSLISAQREGSNAEVVDIPKDVDVGLSGCDSPGSSNGTDQEDEENLNEKSTTLPCVNSQISVLVNISSETV